jgi:CRISPR-associated endonuclease Csn1
MSEELKRTPYILGLDLGAASLGWAVVGLNAGKPAQHIAGGVRIFPEAVDKLEQGLDEPKNAQRRTARHMRRQTDRRARRVAGVFHVLQNAGLLPPFPAGTTVPEPLARHDLINRLDADLAAMIPGLISTDCEHRCRSVFHYRLRALALHQDLPLYAVGRVFLHIAQRRGFRSGRLEGSAGDGDKATKSEAAKELGQVRAKIESLPAEFLRVGATTIGEYWSKLDPLDKRIRGVGNWSAREMHSEEFDRIWERQARCHPGVMTPLLKRILRRRVFFQRPLKSSVGFIGTCELEPGRRRAPLAHLLYQRFRLLQTVNDLRIVGKSGPGRTLTADERAKALEMLSGHQTVTFKSLAKALRLPPGEAFSHEEGDRKDMPGNRTECKLRAVFGDRWNDLPDREKNEIAGYVRSMDNAAALCRIAQTRWGLDQEKAAALASIQLEQGYGRLSLTAIRKLLPLMEQGIPYMTAVQCVYPERQRSTAHDLLPPVLSLRVVRNPAVIRALTELRKVVNEIIREYGRPERIQIELARELKKPARLRKQIAQENRRREAQRKAAIEEIFRQCGLGNPSSGDIAKALLWEECHHQDPYSGECINFHDLFGRDAKWEIEHIIPYSRSLDDSLSNKTLCSREMNRAKGNRTPFEAFGGTPEWEDMKARMAKMVEHASKADKDAAIRKFERFTMEEGVDELFRDFTHRQLNDTKYASRLAVEYLGLLYGGVCDEQGIRRVNAVSGGVTAQLRKGWRLHSILRDGPSQGDVKPRDDHRHHAIDALVVALTDPAAVQALSRASERSRLDHRIGFRVDEPWPGLLDQTRRVIGAISVSHRPDHRLRGPLHADSLYSPPLSERGGPARVRIRKPLASLTAGQVEDIVDDAVRAAVQRKLAELGETEPKVAFKNGLNLPTLDSRHGPATPIRRVRLYAAVSPRQIGAGPAARHVVSEGNHHLAVYRQPADARRPARWTGRVVSLLDAAQRKAEGAPVIAPADEDGRQLVMALYKGDMVDMFIPRSDPPQRDLFVIRGFSMEKRGSPEINLVRHNLAGEIKDLRERREWIRIRSWDDFRALDPRPVQLDALGRRKPDGSQSNP